MNVALIAPRFPPALDGVGDHAERIAHALVKRGDRLTVFTESGFVRKPAGFELVEVGTRWTLRAALAVSSRILEGAFDRVLMEYTPFLYGVRSTAPLAIGLAARRSGTPLGIFAHEAFYPKESRRLTDRSRSLALALRDRLVLGLGDAIYVGSPAKAARVREVAAPLSRRVRTVAIGANVEPGDARWMPLEQPRRRLVTFGVVMPRRRLELTIQALAELTAAGRDLELAVAGRVYDRAYADGCIELATTLGVAERVRFFESLEPDALTLLLVSSELAIHAAREGTIPSSGALLATLAHGLPVVAVRTPHDDPALAPGVAFSADNPEALAGEIAALLDDRAEAAALAQRGRTLYHERCDWNRIASQALEALAPPAKVRDAAYA